MKKIRFGITGSGYMARTHAEAIKLLGSQAELVAITGGSRAPTMAERFGIAVEKTVTSLVHRPDIDAVIVTTPHYIHVSDAMLALEAGKHVLVEKPMATNLEDCDRMLDAAARGSLVLAVGYTLRFRNNAPIAREIIASNAIGRIFTMHFSMIRRIDDNFGGNKLSWIQQPQAIGFIIDGLPHGLDMMRWLTGAEVKTVAGFSRSFLPGRPVEDSTVGILEFSNGAICSLHTTEAAAGPFPREEARLSIIGSAGGLDLDAFGDLYITDQKEGWRLLTTQPKVDYANPDAAFTSIGRMQAFYEQIESFIHGIQGRPMKGGSGIDGRAGVAACLALLESSKEGRLVSL